MMYALAQAKRLLANLLALGGKRLAALGLVGLAVFAATGFAGYYLSRPTTEPLYSGLDRDDVIGIGSALKEAGIAFDVSADGATVLVAVGQSAQARMTLAEKGLPHSGSMGNELYDKLGSLGLTSFMQEVTRVRAIEGELARTIQMIRGVKAARVHIVMGDEGSFRRERQPPSASVIIRTDGADDRAAGQAIRHLVAAAVPNMKVDEVTVLNVDGQLLASGSDSIENAPDNLLTLEKDVAREIRETVTKTLAPYLSLRNFEVSVAARLNADKTQTNETVFNPEGRAERSVRVVKEKLSSQNSAGEPPAGVESNLPKPKTSTNDSKQSKDATDKKEEMTNYEISSKSITTTSAGYVINGLSVAVLVNRAALAASLGDKASPDAIDKQVKEIEQLVTSAAGLQKESWRRGEDFGRRFRRFGQGSRTGAGAVVPGDRGTADGNPRQRRRDPPGRGAAHHVRHQTGHAGSARASAGRHGGAGSRHRKWDGMAMSAGARPSHGDGGRESSDQVRRWARPVPRRTCSNEGTRVRSVICKSSSTSMRNTRQQFSNNGSAKERTDESHSHSEIPG